MKLNRIVVIDDHSLLRETWSYLIDSFEGFAVVARFASADEAIKQLAQLQPDIILLDINLPGMSGIDAVVPLKQKVPNVKIIGLTMHNHPVFAKQMMKNGAIGYLTKSASIDELKKALVEVSNNRQYICSEIKDVIVRQAVEDGQEDVIKLLTSRELEIIRHLKQGCTSRQIAEYLSITPKTVEVHRYNILRKLKLRNTAALIDYINKRPDIF